MQHEDFDIIEAFFTWLSQSFVLQNNLHIVYLKGMTSLCLEVKWHVSSLCNETHHVIPSAITLAKDASTTLNMVNNAGKCKLWLIFDNL